MKAIEIRQTGGPEVLQYSDMADSKPGPNEVLVQHKAVGVNFIDVYHRTGLYPRKPPFIPGLEAAGVVFALGHGVEGFEVGQKVTYSGSFGAYGDFNAVPADKLVPIPDEIDFESAAALMLQGMTAHYLVHDTYQVQSGQTVLLHAAAGGVGLLATQMMKARGARVIGTVSTPEKAALAKQFGADQVILYTQQDFVEVVKEITGGRGVDVVYDSVGKTTFLKSLDCLTPRGMLVSFGQSSGKIPDFDPALLGNKGSLYLTRPSLTHYTADREALLHRASQVLKWAADGTIRVHIGNRFPLSKAANAHQELQNRHTTGKILLIP